MREYKVLLLDENTSLYKELVKEQDIKLKINLCNYAQTEDCYQKDVDMLILNFDIQHVDVFSLYEKIKSRYAGPIIFISSCDNASVRIKGLEMGADAFIHLPCHAKEIKLRVCKILEHLNVANSQKIGKYEINSVLHEIKYKGKDLKLTPYPYKLLCYLLENANTNLSRRDIIQDIWGHEADYDNRVVDTNINLLRKVTQDGNIKSIRGIGYRYNLTD